MAAKKTKKKTTAKKRSAPAKSAKKAAWDELRAYALALPGAHEDHPWGEVVVKVAKKVFVFLGRPPLDIGLSVKLPHSKKVALGLSYTEPTGYGLGKSGWVSVHLPDNPHVDLLRAWIEESYRAVAPKRMIKELDGSVEA